jgi:hypothetical protein
MRQSTLRSIWVATPETVLKDGEPYETNVRIRKIDNVNIQKAESEIDYAQYGQRINEILKLRTKKVPDIKKGDYVFMSCPNAEARPEFEVIKIAEAYENTKLPRNPVVIDVRLLT